MNYFEILIESEANLRITYKYRDKFDGLLAIILCLGDKVLREVTRETPFYFDVDQTLFIIHDKIIGSQTFYETTTLFIPNDGVNIYNGASDGV